MIILFKYFKIFNISNFDKEINKELPEDDLIEDRNMLECFLNKYYVYVISLNISVAGPHSDHNGTQSLHTP